MLGELVTVKNTHPVYRLWGGQVMCQESAGRRWERVDDAIAIAMLKAFDGVPPEQIAERCELVRRVPHEQH
jgi:hypothetical protein